MVVGFFRWQNFYNTYHINQINNRRLKIEIEVTQLNNNEDLFSNLVTMEDFGQFVAKRFVAKIKESPMEFAKEMKEI